MSIINQALRDLDARKTDAEMPPDSIQPVSVSAHPASRRRLWIVLSVLFLIAGMAGWFAMQFKLTVLPQTERLAQVEVASGAVTPVQVPAPLPEAPAAEPVDIPVSSAMSVDASLPTLKMAKHIPPASEQSQHQALQLQPGAETPVGSMPSEIKPLNVAAAGSTGLKAVNISKELKKSTPEEDAEDRYRKAMSLVNKGRENQAQPLLEEALRLSPGHVAARQVLATLLNEAGLNREAEGVLREGRKVSPDSAWFAQSLARLQTARGDYEGAAITMQNGLEAKGVNAEYRASYAALLSRLKQHAEAAHQYEMALKLQPDKSAWWLGLGLALSAQGQSAEARAAYGRALAAGNLPEKLEDFVRAKLSGP
ncbi:MAG TPA: tetratricopeptide repeat protein [Thiobacillus sp.]